MRVFIFIDMISLNEELIHYPTIKIDYDALTDYYASSQEGRFLLNSYVFHGVHPDSPYLHQESLNQLKMLGYIDYPVEGVYSQNQVIYNYEIPMALQILHVQYHMKPDVIIILSRNEQFIPLVNYLKQQGTRVEISSIHPSKLAAKASGFIHLQPLLIEEEMSEKDDPRNLLKELNTDEES